MNGRIIPFLWGDLLMYHSSYVGPYKYPLVWEWYEINFYRLPLSGWNIRNTSNIWPLLSWFSETLYMLYRYRYPDFLILRLPLSIFSSPNGGLKRCKQHHFWWLSLQFLVTSYFFGWYNPDRRCLTPHLWTPNMVSPGKSMVLVRNMFYFP